MCSFVTYFSYTYKTVKDLENTFNALGYLYQEFWGLWVVLNSVIHEAMGYHSLCDRIGLFLMSKANFRVENENASLHLYPQVVEGGSEFEIIVRA